MWADNLDWIKLASDILFAKVAPTINFQTLIAVAIQL